MSISYTVSQDTDNKIWSIDIQAGMARIGIREGSISVSSYTGLMVEPQDGNAVKIVIKDPPQQQQVAQEKKR